jgi:hypothetical protein
MKTAEGIFSEETISEHAILATRRQRFGRSVLGIGTAALAYTAFA